MSSDGVFRQHTDILAETNERLLSCVTSPEAVLLQIYNLLELRLRNCHEHRGGIHHDYLGHLQLSELEAFAESDVAHSYEKK